MGAALASDLIAIANVLAAAGAALATLALVVLGLGLVLRPIVTAGRRGGGRTPDGQ